jgi:hypothetical protein
MLERLRVAPSFGRPRVSNDNAYAESLFRTCKFRPNYPGKPFGGEDKARTWTQRFVRWYNQEHKHGGRKFVTPAQRHSGRDAAISRVASRFSVMREIVIQALIAGHEELETGKYGLVESGTVSTRSAKASGLR